MKAYRWQSSSVPTSPLAQGLAFVAAVLLLVSALFIGLIALAVVAGLLLIFGTAAAARLWWLRRKLRARMKHAQPHRGEQVSGPQVIEGEYIEIRRYRDD